MPEKERDSEHPCDQFAQDDTEMREAVLRARYSSHYKTYCHLIKSVARSTAYMHNITSSSIKATVVCGFFPDYAANGGVGSILYLYIYVRDILVCGEIHTTREKLEQARLIILAAWKRNGTHDLPYARYFITLALATSEPRQIH